MDIGALGPGAVVHALNSSNIAVGQSETAQGERAFVTVNGVMTELDTLIDPSLMVIFDDAFQINTSGQILATGAGGNGTVFLLTPIPEPGSLALILLPAPLLLRRRRARPPLSRRDENPTNPPFAIKTLAICHAESYPAKHLAPTSSQILRRILLRMTAVGRLSKSAARKNKFQINLLCLSQLNRLFTFFVAQSELRPRSAEGKGRGTNYALIHSILASSPDRLRQR